MARIRLKNPGKPVAWLIRAIGETLRYRIANNASLAFPSEQRHIWVFWHNRMFLIPWLRENLIPGQEGAFLTSPSGDGQIIAEACADFKLKPVRGSSSRRGAQAMVELANYVKTGHDIGITPDGPRGPRYHMNLGVIKLAQLTGAPLMPVHIRYARALRFPTWDGFLLPVPFSTVHIEFAEPFTVPRRMTEEECEHQRVALQTIMRMGTGELTTEHDL
ncbi:MAG: lysophospholipid acyltransferase family protein [Roseimicrobium sp.]